jgi:hypothetical protein
MIQTLHGFFCILPVTAHCSPSHTMGSFRFRSASLFSLSETPSVRTLSSLLVSSPTWARRRRELHLPSLPTPPFQPERDVASGGEAVDTAAAAASLVGRRRRLQGAAAAGGGAVGERGLRAVGAGRAGVAVEPRGLPLLPCPRRGPARLPRLRRRAHPLPHGYAPARLLPPPLLLTSSSTRLVIREIMLELIQRLGSSS